MRRIAMCAGLAALAAGACGGDDEGGAPSEREFRAQAAQVCQAANARLIALSVPEGRAGIPAVVEEAEAIVRRRTAELRRLEAPKSLRPRLERALRADGRVTASLVELGLLECVDGAYGLPRGRAFGDRIRIECQRTLDLIGTRVDESLPVPDVVPVSARAVDALAASLARQTAPPPARVLYGEAVAGLRALARDLRRAGRSVRAANAAVASDRSTVNALAWSIINVDGCADLHDTLSGRVLKAAT